MYRALVAERDTNSVSIPLGETASIDGWSITFLGAIYLPADSGEAGDTVVVSDPSARLRATALGPARGSQ
jgi:hypothetical protein